jgi:hypothetical protein
VPTFPSAPRGSPKPPPPESKTLIAFTNHNFEVNYPAYKAGHLERQ